MDSLKFGFSKVGTIIVAVSAAICMVSCYGCETYLGPQPEPHEYKSYTASVMTMTWASVHARENNDIIVELNYNWEGMGLPIMSGKYFDECIGRFGDTSYVGYWDHNDMFRAYPCFNGGYPNMIEIKSDKDWDAEHPAGSLLNDLFDYYALSAYPFVKAGYEPYVPSGDDDVIYDPIWQYYYEDRYYDMSGSGGYDEKFDEVKEYYGYEYNPLERYPVVKPFGDVEESDYYMLGTGISDGAMFILRPRIGPEIEKWHNIKVRVAVTGVQFVNQGDFVLDFRDEAEKSGNQVAARHGR